MAGKQFNEVAETSTSTLQEMNQAEIENLVDVLYTQRLVKNGSAVLTRQEAFAALTRVFIETSLRFFFAPLFFIRESAEKGETRS